MYLIFDYYLGWYLVFTSSIIISEDLLKGSWNLHVLVKAVFDELRDVCEAEAEVFTLHGEGRVVADQAGQYT